MHRLSWSASRAFIPERGAPLTPARVVDSWLIRGGRIRGLGLHFERFQRSCSELVPELPEAEVAHFLEAVRVRLPRYGGWWPRVEAYAGADAGLALWLRPAPESSGQLTLWVPPVPDPREHPRVKGPDLAGMARLRAAARAAGADDALLFASDGAVLETAHAAIAWWRTGVLCVPTPELATLPSVTLRLLIEAAEARGVPVDRERRGTRELDGLEVWTLDAPHGIRVVGGWAGAGIRAPATDIARLARWRAALSASVVDASRPMPSTPAAGLR